MSGYQDIDFQKARDILDREKDSVLLDVREEEEFITCLLYTSRCV